MRIVRYGEPIKLPENLESLPRADHFPTQRHRWNTNEYSEGIWGGTSKKIRIYPLWKPTGIKEDIATLTFSLDFQVQQRNEFPEEIHTPIMA
ncbi:hypothetical protein JTB14_031820 [Gonioctena quinquepunctata]|nr:hypothetical protein JTB14_031820 [Gonioctena quinquepunctata]